ncbi:hypothetical protein [Halosolutus halophilus]|uniref:hypothetical protein n=1 Tax=Halosolutus halophilus TaxID=1552990 RepID=UPI0022351D05|nr:hypothetical protein [Halosolutus halophilus]
MYNTPSSYLDYPNDALIASENVESIFGIGRRNFTGFPNVDRNGRIRCRWDSIDGPGYRRIRPIGIHRCGVRGEDELLGEMRTFVDALDEDVSEQQGYGPGIRHLRIDGEDEL